MIARKPDPGDWFGALGSGMTCNQHKEMFVLQMEREKELEQVQMECERECEKVQLERERLHLGQERLRLEAQRFASQQPGRPDRDDDPVPMFDIRTNLCLVPTFNEKDWDMFFDLFERVAESGDWFDSKFSMLQYVLTGKAQEAFCLLAAEAALRKYELMSEAYRTHFKTWKKRVKQTHLEFTGDLICQHTRWRNTSKVNTFEALFALIVLDVCWRPQRHPGGGRLGR